MKRLNLTTVAILALVASFAVGSLALAAKGDKKVKTNVTAKYDQGSDPGQNYNEAKFTGKVKSSKTCKNKRSVQIKGIGKAKSNKSGKYVISAGSGAPNGTYNVKVKKKTVKKGNKKTICQKTSAKVKV